METHVPTNAGVLIGAARQAMRMWCNWSNPEYVLQCMYFGVLRRDENWDSFSIYTREADGKREGEVDPSPKPFIVVELNEHFVPKSAR